MTDITRDQWLELYNSALKECEREYVRVRGTHGVTAFNMWLKAVTHECGDKRMISSFNAMILANLPGCLPFLAHRVVTLILDGMHPPESI